jgi:hypothetical protein
MTGRGDEPMFGEIFFTQAGGAVVRTPYLEDFVSDLKEAVPAAYRHWDKIEKFWYIEPTYARVAAELFVSYFPDGNSFDLARKYKEPPEWAKILFVQVGAPLEVVEAAYRALAKKYHPDRGGDEVRIKTLNSAIEQARAATAPKHRATGGW